MDRNRIFSDDLTSVICNEEKLPAVFFQYPQLNPANGIKYCGDAEDGWTFGDEKDPCHGQGGCCFDTDHCPDGQQG